MFRKFALAAFIALLPALAWAQNPTCPTRPVGDNTNACASTAFVQNALTTGLPLAHTHIYVGNGSNIATDFGAFATFSDSGVLTMNLNTGSVPAPDNGTSLHIVGPDTTINRIELDAFGNLNAVTARQSGGTLASQSATPNNQIMLAVAAFGYNGSSFNIIGPQIRFNATETYGASAWGGDISFHTIQTGTNTLITPLTIGPTNALNVTGIANSNFAAWNSTQSGPTSGSVAGPVNLNLITVSSYNAATNVGTNFADFGAWSSAITGFRVNFTIGGTNLGSTPNQSEPFMGIMGHVRLTTASTLPTGGDFEGVTGLSYINAAAPNANMEGVVGFAVADGVSANPNSISGVFAEIDLINGASTQQRAGVRISSLSTGTASTGFDAAISVGASSSSGGFKAWSYFNQGGGGAPIQSTGDIFVSNGAMTINNVFNASNWTVTTNIMNFPNWIVTGAGAETLAVSQTVPLIIGGTAISSTLTLESTSGAGSADAIIMKTASQTERARITSGGLFNIGPAVTPDSLLTVNGNTVATSVAPPATTYLHVIGADSALPRITIDAFSGVGTIGGIFAARHARGTAASPTGSQASDNLFIFAAFGLQSNGVYTTATSQIVFNATEALASGANGSRMRLVTVPTGTASAATAMYVQASGGIAIGADVDPSAGGLYVNGATITLNALGTDSTHTDRTVCQDTTSKSLFFGSGAAGICLGTSSARFKHDIMPLNAGLDQIEKLQAVSYRLNADHGDQNKLLYGFTAEQGETTLPDLVGLDLQGRPQTFDYMGVVPVLVRAVQQLKADNDNLREQLRAIGGQK